MLMLLFLFKPQENKLVTLQQTTNKLKKESMTKTYKEWAKAQRWNKIAKNKAEKKIGTFVPGQCQTRGWFSDLEQHTKITKITNNEQRKRLYPKVQKVTRTHK